jgi:hypothetical protein
MAESGGEPTRAIPLITYDGAGGYRAHEDGLAWLRSVRGGPVTVLAVAGPYRTGKSFLINRALLRARASGGFDVGPTVQPCTKGLWLWPDMIDLSDGAGGPASRVILIDTEGMGAADSDASHDTRVFTLAALLSSVFLYNSMGTISEDAVERLAAVAGLSRLVAKRAGDEAAGAIVFPHFTWVVRDFVLQLRAADGGTLSPGEYLESVLADVEDDAHGAAGKNRTRALLREAFSRRSCHTLVRPSGNEQSLQRLNTMAAKHLRRDFKRQIDELRADLASKATYKTIALAGAAVDVDGSMLADLCEQYAAVMCADAAGTGLPPIVSVWEYVCGARASRAADDARAEWAAAESALRSGGALARPHAVERARTAVDAALAVYDAATGELDAEDAEKREGLAQELRGRAAALVDALSAAWASSAADALRTGLADLTRASGAFHEWRDGAHGVLKTVVPDDVATELPDARAVVWWSGGVSSTWQAVDAFYAPLERELQTMRERDAAAADTAAKAASNAAELSERAARAEAQLAAAVAEQERLTESHKEAMEAVYAQAEARVTDAARERDDAVAAAADAAEERDAAVRASSRATAEREEAERRATESDARLSVLGAAALRAEDAEARVTELEALAKTQAAAADEAEERARDELERVSRSSAATIAEMRAARESDGKAAASALAEARAQARAEHEAALAKAAKERDTALGELRSKAEAERAAALSAAQAEAARELDAARSEAARQLDGAKKDWNRARKALTAERDRSAAATREARATVAALEKEVATLNERVQELGQRVVDERKEREESVRALEAQHRDEQDAAARREADLSKTAFEERMELQSRVRDLEARAKADETARSGLKRRAEEAEAELRETKRRKLDNPDTSAELLAARERFSWMERKQSDTAERLRTAEAELAEAKAKLREIERVAETRRFEQELEFERVRMSYEERLRAATRAGSPGAAAGTAAGAAPGSS